LEDTEEIQRIVLLIDVEGDDDEKESGTYIEGFLDWKAVRS